MRKSRLVSAAALFMTTSGLLLSQPRLGHASPTLNVSAAPAVAPSMPGDLSAFSSGATLSLASPLLALEGLQLASNDPEMSPLLAPMLAFYSQLLALDGTAASGIALQRLKVRLGAAAAGNPSMLEIHDVLAADFEKLEVVAVGGAQLRELGVAGGDVQRLPVLPALVETVKANMMELPHGLNNFKAPIALAVWGEVDGQSRLVTLVVRAD